MATDPPTRLYSCWPLGTIVEEQVIKWHTLFILEIWGRQSTQTVITSIESGCLLLEKDFLPQKVPLKKQYIASKPYHPTVPAGAAAITQLESQPTALRGSHSFT